MVGLSARAEGRMDRIILNKTWQSFAGTRVDN